MKKIRVALIGCGRISYKHIDAFKDLKDRFELVAVSDPILERMEEKKASYEEGVPSDVKMYEDYHEMLEAEEPDLCAIATESGYHGKIALDCLDKDCHLVIEKPMALDLSEIDKINDMADEKNLKVAVCHQNRFNPPIMKLREAVDQGLFGRIFNITARILWTRDQNYYDMAPWRGTRALDGGTLMNQCIHNIDLLQWMMGSEVVRVKSERSTFLRNIEMEDYGALVLRFKNGSIGLIEGSAVVYPKNLEETLSVFGEKGTVVIGGLALNEMKVWDFKDGGNSSQGMVKDEISSVYGNGHLPFYEDVYRAITEDRQPLINGHEGRKSVDIVLRSYEDDERNDYENLVGE